MTSPLALIFYESLLTGNQLVNRLQDLGYRVLVVTDLIHLPDQAAAENPLIVIAELGGMAERVCANVRKLHAQHETKHIPVLATYKPAGKKADQDTLDAARDAGIALVASEPGFLTQLPDLLERALEIP